MSFGQRLREARVMKGFTQKQLAEKLDIGASTVTGYEKDNSEPNMYTINKIMKILNVDANFLFQDEISIIESEENILSEKIRDIANKYKNLDLHGRKTIDLIMEREIERVNEIKQLKEQMFVLESNNIEEPPADHLLLIAAHNETENEEELRKMENDIKLLKKLSGNKTG